MAVSRIAPDLKRVVAFLANYYHQPLDRLECGHVTHCTKLGTTADHYERCTKGCS